MRDRLRHREELDDGSTGAPGPIPDLPPLDGDGPVPSDIPRIVDDDRQRSYEAVFISEYPAMVRLATLLVDEIDVAEELVQDAFVKLHERWRRVDQPGAYLRTSVVNACRNELRRRGRERRRLRRAAPLTTEVALGADELSDALAALPPKRRAAVVLRYYEGLDEAQIAETLGVRRGTVKSLLSRGLAELRRALDDA